MDIYTGKLAGPPKQEPSSSTAYRKTLGEKIGDAIVEIFWLIAPRVIILFLLAAGLLALVGCTKTTIVGLEGGECPPGAETYDATYSPPWADSVEVYGAKCPQ